MSKFFKYIFLVLKHTFWGADSISKTLSVFSLFVVVGFQFTNLPWEVRLGLLITLVFLGTFKVWLDERKAKEAAEGRLKEARNKIPTFEITVGEIKRYTIKSMIDSYTREVQNIQLAIDAKKAEKTKQTHGSNAQTLFKITGVNLAKISEQLTSALSSPLIPRQETAEEKLERLSSYLAKLQTYEARLGRLYKIDISLTASAQLPDIVRDV